MIIIGIDFSIQFPAVCISTDFTKFHWIACVNTNLTKSYKKLVEDIQLEYKDFEIIFLPPKDFKKPTYSGIERAKLANYSLLVDKLIEKIKEYTHNSSDLIVSIEGIAYGAQGNALIDICQATGMLRKKVLDDLLNGQDERFFVFSPSELKNAIGAKGNANKFEIYTKFKETPLLAAGSALYNIIKKYESDIVKDKIVKSPISDMIDAYLAVLKIHNSLTEA